MKRSRKKPHALKSNRTSDTRAELLARAKRYGIQGRHRMTKSQLVRALKPYLKRRPQRPVRHKTAQPNPASFQYESLPWSYGQTELVLIPVGPFLLHAYWDFSLKDWETLQTRKRPVVLRIYDVTMIKFDGTNAHHSSDVPVFLNAQSWYVPIWTAEKSLCAELGWMLPDGSFHPIVRSNVIQTPRAGVSSFKGSRWIEIRPDGSRATDSVLAKTQDLKRLSRQTLAFWNKLKQQADGLTAGEITGLSSERLSTTT